MFMDRYLWNLQFGSQRIVPKKRASGTPIDGVVVSAGIPESTRPWNSSTTSTPTASRT